MREAEAKVALHLGARPRRGLEALLRAAVGEDGALDLGDPERAQLLAAGDEGAGVGVGRAGADVGAVGVGAGGHLGAEEAGVGAAGRALVGPAAGGDEVAAPGAGRAREGLRLVCDAEELFLLLHFAESRPAAHKWCGGP